MSCPSPEWYASSRNLDLDQSYEWSIKRAPPRPGNLDLIVCSHIHREIRIHYTGHGNTPCLAAGCGLCKHGPSRFRAYVLAMENRTARKLLVELPLKAWMTIETATLSDCLLRGLKVRLFRVKDGRTAPVDAQVFGRLEDTSVLPSASDPWPEMCKLWKLRAPSTSQPLLPTVGLATEAERAECVPRIANPGRHSNGEVQHIGDILPPR